MLETKPENGCADRDRANGDFPVASGPKSILAAVRALFCKNCRVPRDTRNEASDV